MEFLVGLVALWIIVVKLPDEFWESRLGRVLLGVMMVLFVLLMAGMCMASDGGWEARWG